jgi:hypothetical protein
MFWHDWMSDVSPVQVPDGGSQCPARLRTGSWPLPKVVRKANMTNWYCPDAHVSASVPSLPFWPQYTAMPPARAVVACRESKRGMSRRETAMLLV